MSDKFTPGPWTYNHPDGVTLRHPPIFSDTGIVGNATWFGNIGETEANARLIAAAPDLLESCRKAVCAVAYAAGLDGSFVNVYEALDDAIAKATGGAS